MVNKWYVKPSESESIFNLQGYGYWVFNTIPSGAKKSPTTVDLRRSTGIITCNMTGD